MAELIVQVTDHEDRVDRLIEQYRGLPDLEALIKSYLAQVQDLENVIFEVILERVIDNAVGVQLTVLGNIVQQPRLTPIDADFKTAINARIAINLSDSTPEDLLRVAALILTGGEEVEIREEPPGQVRITVVDPLTVDPTLAQVLLDEADPAGVRLLFAYTVTVDEPDAFTFGDTGGAGVVGKGFTDTGGGAVEDGKLAAVIG